MSAFGRRSGAGANLPGGPRPAFGVARPMQGGGLAVEYLCALWAYQGYGLIDSTSAFAVLAALSAVGIAWSLWKRRALFAAIGQLGAFLAPVLASTGGGTLGSLSLYSIGVAVLGVVCALRLAIPTLSALALVGASVLLAAADLNGLPAGGSLIAPAFINLNNSGFFRSVQS